MSLKKIIHALEWKEKVFQALSSSVRRQILSNLSNGAMNAGEIADQFQISKPSLSKHLSILENAGLISAEKKGKYIYYSLVEDNLINTLTGFVQEIRASKQAKEKGEE